MNKQTNEELLCWFCRGQVVDVCERWCGEVEVWGAMGEGRAMLLWRGYSVCYEEWSGGCVCALGELRPPPFRGVGGDRAKSYLGLAGLGGSRGNSRAMPSYGNHRYRIRASGLPMCGRVHNCHQLRMRRHRIRKAFVTASQRSFVEWETRQTPSIL